MHVRSVDDPVNKSSKIRKEKNIITDLKQTKKLMLSQEVEIIEGLVAVLEIDRSMVPILRNASKTKLLEVAVKADKVWGRFKIHNITKIQLLLPIG